MSRASKVFIHGAKDYDTIVVNGRQVRFPIRDGSNPAARYSTDCGLEVAARNDVTTQCNRVTCPTCRKALCLPVSNTRVRRRMK